MSAGFHDGISGRLFELAGFDSIWGSRFKTGAPDTELLPQCEIIDRALSIPVIADNGFSNAIIAAARAFEAAGTAGISIEDNPFPNRCSLYGDVSRFLVPVRERAANVRARKDAQHSDRFFLIDRAGLCVQAGAEAMLVPPEPDAPLEDLTRQWDVFTPQVAVLTTYDKTSSAAELHARGHTSVERNLMRLRHCVRVDDLGADMVPLVRVFDLVGVEEPQRDEAKDPTVDARESMPRLRPWDLLGGTPPS